MTPAFPILAQLRRASARNLLDLCCRRRSAVRRWIDRCLFPAAALTALLALGCGQGLTSTAASQGGRQQTDRANEMVARNTDPTRIAKCEPPAEAVTHFLDAVRRGDDATTASMLSSVARQKAAATNRTIHPPASDTAKFTVGTVEYIGDDGARVAADWTDIDGNGQSTTDHALWVLRREPEGWRIAGVAATIFPGEPPLLLNFEDPEEMQRKQQWVHEEFLRRSQGASTTNGPSQAGEPARQAKADPTANDIRR